MNVRGFSALWQKRSAEELHNLAHIKRFLECLKGDAVFREKLTQHIASPNQVAQEYGIEVNPDLFRPLYESAYQHNTDSRFALAGQWNVYCAEVAAVLDSFLSTGDTETINPRFHGWRRRQIARLISEIGGLAQGIVHPIAAYELSQGCSVGCWFCGVSASQFKGYLPFNADNQRLWQGILRAMVQRFGTAAQTGFCYWATDPTDNPDYVAFIQEHQKITGFVPQTTTAAPLKNIEQTREILNLFEYNQGIWNRFSILSVAQLRRVHASFSAEELLGVELVLQNPEAISLKHVVGKATATQVQAQRAKHHQNLLINASPAQNAGTIACVSGFLIKPLERQVQLVSPCRASKQWPNGYRIYGTASFMNGDDIGDALDSLINRYMPPTLVDSDSLAFRPDLNYQAIATGFKLSNAQGQWLIQGKPWLTAIGELINTGLYTKARLQQLLIKSVNGDELNRFLNELYQASFLNDDPVNGGINN